MRSGKSKIAAFREAADDARPNLRPLTPPNEPTQRFTTMSWRPFAGLTFGFVSAMTVVGVFLPVFGDRLPPVALIPAAIGLFVAVNLLEKLPSNRAFVTASVAAVAVVVLSVFGASNQVVLDGVVYSSVSAEARSHRLVGELFDELETMSEYDELLAMAAPDARARYGQFEPARRDLESIARHWSNYDLSTAPDPDFIEIIELVKVAATFGAQSLDTKFSLLTTPSQHGEQSLNETRLTFSSSVLEAAAKLRPLADKYLVELTVVTE